MSPCLRKFVLTTHITATVGWMGAAMAFLGLAVVGLTSPKRQAVRGVYLAMQPTAWYVLVPLALASLLTGLVQSLGSAWGLVRHYWIVFKLMIAAFATFVLLIYTETFAGIARTAADPAVDLAAVRNPSPLIHASLALILLLIATVLAVYKPRGVTAYGRRKLHERRSTP